ncbi:MAG: isoleucine--tRNA ligase [Phycisphaerae bacterium]
MTFEPVPARFDFPGEEQRILRFWQDRRIYEKSLKQREGCPQFVFYEGPPTANGLPHPGHCLTRVMKDLFPRYKTMCGYYCHRKAGWDTHGLPVEVEVCKELGIASKQQIEQYGVEAFIHKCCQSVFRYIREWEELTRRLGFWINLDEAYVTYHQSYVESVWWALKVLFERGLLYQVHKVVWWWPQGGTALSAGEVGQGYRLIDDPSITVRFRLAGGPDTSLLAWTTTPWTLPSNVALAVRPEFDYAFVRHKGGETFILARELIKEVFAGLTIDVEKDLQIVKVVKGSDLVGTRYEPIFRYKQPSGGRAYEVVAADFVTLQQGTGVVHVAPAFGEEDYRLCQEQGMGFLQLIEPDGRFAPEATDFAGRFCKEADNDIIAWMQQRGFLLKRQTVRHEYPFCWRAEDEPLIQYARRSWFIRTTDFVQQFLANNRQIGWLPQHIRDGRFGNFLETNVDWALSRERYWGTPLPIWQCQKTGYQEAIGSYAELLAKPDVRGTEAWERAKQRHPDLPDDLRVHKPYIDEITYRSPRDPSARMRRVPEVIDCWFDSGAMPFAQWGYPHRNRELFRQRFPADFISEAIDQTRGWFYTLLAISTMLFGQRSGSSEPSDDGTFVEPFPHPFRNCIVLGLVMGEDGKKLSKSQRNYKEPSYIFQREGADAMRWSLLSAQSPWTSVRFQEQAIAEHQREFLIRLYNVYSFLVIYANIDGFDPSQTGRPGPAELGELDRWILSELHQTIRDVRSAMDRYENYPAAQRMVQFVDALSNWYVRRSRQRFWKSQKDRDKTNAYWTLWSCLETMCRLAAPFVPFLTESMYQNLVRRPFGDRMPESVHLCDYPVPEPGLIDQTLSREMSLVRQIVSLGRSARTAARIKVRQPLPLVEIVLADPSRQRWLEAHSQLIGEELNVKRVEFAARSEQYVQYRLKPQFALIGPRFGPLTPKIKAALAQGEPAQMYRQLQADGRIRLDIDGRTIELGSEDVQIGIVPRPGWAAAQGRDAVVIISTQISDALRAEGLARELVHHVQSLRKQLDLPYTARIELSLDCSDELAQICRRHADYIVRETLTTNIRYGRQPIPAAQSSRVKLGQESVTIYLRPVG